MKRLLAATVATVIATSGCGYFDAWRNGCCGDSYCGAGCGDGAYGGEEAYFGDGAQYPVYNEGEVGPQMFVPGETIPAPTGQSLPGPAQ
jgi:hypothetical protein